MNNNTSITLYGLFLRAAHDIHNPQRDYLFKKEGGSFQGISYAYCEEQINACSARFVELGLQKGERVAFLTENCPEYFLFDLGSQQLGLVNASIYPTLSESEVEFIFNDSGSQAILVGSPFLLKKLSKAAPNLPNLKKVVTLFDDHKKNWDDPRVESWNEFTQKGKEIYPTQKEKVKTMYDAVTQDDLATLIYTSGTTGNPKGAMLTHKNFISDIASGLELMRIVGKDDSFLSFLPLSHVYERMCSYYLALFVGAQTAFAESIEKIASNIKEFKPTIVACVPRLLEKIEEKVKKNVEKKGGLSAVIFNWAITAGMKRQALSLLGRKPGPLLNIRLAVAEKLVFSKVKTATGGRLKFFVSGGGAMQPIVAEFFANFGILVLEGYGLTETSPFISVNPYDRQRIGTVGRIGPGQEVAIQHPETLEIYTVQNFNSFTPGFACPEGEILMRGPNLMKGYWNQPEETAKVIDKEGWFHTGDIGNFQDGFLKITDRLKNIIVNAYGKNIYPTQVEANYLQSRRIEQIFIIGDKRDFLTAIVVPSKTEVMEIFGKTEAWFAQNETWVNDPEIVDWIKQDIHKLSNQLAKFERVKDFVVKREPFSIENGEMTPKQSVKRKVVEQKFKAEIDGMYERTAAE